MFDFTPLSRTVALLLAAFLVAFPVLGVLGYAVRADWYEPAAMAVLFVGFPVAFAVGACSLALDFHRRLRSGRLSTTQAVGHRAAGVMVTAGSMFAFVSGLWPPACVCVAALLLMFVPTRDKTVESTWSPR